MRLDRSEPSPRVAVASRRGAAVVETAVVLPVFLLIVMGIVEFGRAMMVCQLLTNGARHGARLAIVEGSTNAAVQQAIENFLTETLHVAAGDLAIQIEVEPAPGHPDPLDSLAAAQSKDLVKVTVSVPFEKVAYVSGTFLKSTTLSGQCAMRHE